ncbi:MAG: hypothetical protein L3J62_02125 [Gammaproteobacteria bacterium]|nr:hypothetical protein [Gammaproteobacteria bacterium]
MNHKLLGSLLLTSMFALANPAFAGEGHKGGHHDMGDSKGHHDKMGKGEHGGDKPGKGGHKNKKGHHFSPSWAKTLSDEQRVAVDKMHLELGTQHAVLKAKAALLQKEMNVMTAKDDADMSAVHTKIEAFIAVKAEIMKLRYAHLTEMRNALNEQQRISYDMAILKREGAK